MERFQPKSMNNQHFGPVQPNLQIAPKLQENTVDRNNPGQIKQLSFYG